MTDLKSGIAPDNSLLVATEVKNAADVTTATISNSDEIAKGRGSVSSNDTHVGYLAEKIAAGNGVTLAETNDGADETLTISMNTKPPLLRLDNDSLIVGTGAQDTQTELDLTVDANWIGGSSLESASELVHAYEVMASPGTYKLSDKQPQYSAMVETNRQADMQVNNAAFDGTAGTGLNATSVDYNNGTDGDDVTAGMLALIYSDASFTLGRGRGTGAAGAINNLSVALITATTAGAAAGTLTLEAGHQIAINDDDYIIVVDAGELIFRFDGSAWYRHVGAWFNDSGSDLLDLTAQYGSHQKYGSDDYVADEGSDYTTASATFVDIDATNLSLELTTVGGEIMIGFHGSWDTSNINSINNLDVVLDGVSVGGDDGIIQMRQEVAGKAQAISFVRMICGVQAGTHKLTLQWLTGGGTLTLYAGAGTSNLDSHPQFWAREAK